MAEKKRILPDSEFAPSTLTKARKLITTAPELITQDPQFPRVWWVGSIRDPKKKYRVEVGEFPDVGPWAMCTCTHGLNSVGRARCYHVAAMLMRTDREDPSDRA